MFKRIDHIEVLTAQPERTVAFYTGVLGFRERERTRIPQTPKGPLDLVKPMADREELPWYGAITGSTQVQDVFDAKCASCHSGGAGDPFAGQFYTVTVTPEDGSAEQTYQIPVLDLSSRPLNASGARYRGDPITDPVFVRAMELDRCATPKSRITGTPWAPTMMFRGLRSRWTTPWAWQCSIVAARLLKILKTSGIGIVPSANKSARSRPSISSRQAPSMPRRIVLSNCPSS